MSRPRWGDTVDDDDAAKISGVVSLPQGHTKVDGNVRTVTEYLRNDKGEAIKKTTKFKVVNVEKKVYKSALERRKWARFGAAKTEQATDSTTAQMNEDIAFDRVRQQKQTQQEKKQTQAIDFQQAMQANDKQAVSGSIKDILYKKRMERELLRAKGLLSAAERPPDEDGAPPPPLPPPGAGKPGSYVPPSVRNRGAGYVGERMADDRGVGGDRKRDEQPSLRVSNLDLQVSEDDLYELFRPFGNVQRIHIAKDFDTKEQRDFAFVSYFSRDEGERALKALNGFGYDNLILRLEWAAPRAERPAGERPHRN
eukprot:CAMPEP_0119106964 /NCGR_PEP_ID=MMETSP1180-20130426/7835_1 /TAXON_ID=3052 ORGANISM="Chlamydomonas cf sp, Strain CCMP681" /NCGR_SAMPLE_ID=MMETSP1180 /ASSEMBLY_ACC=CAM_ASM_000741 /LENGTH=309 /DNA_ID=CAMNT_0007092379 /DNA_START=21 /DNA_END=950 /DNA_ORIENTATION=-